MKTLDINVGTSGYNNLPWKGIFYPDDLPRSKWFEFYCNHFNAFEINSTFYKFPTVRILSNWNKKSPDGFRFSIKAPKLITHIKRFRDCKIEIDEFYDICTDGLGEKAHLILFQFPPSFKYDPEALELIVAHLNQSFRNVIEFRHTSWWIPEVFDAFKKHKIIFCSVSHPIVPDDLIATSPVFYIRLHGVPKLFYSDYHNEYLQNLSSKIINNESLSEAFFFFNNTASTSGILNALKMQQYAANVIKV